ncbi:Uncharacterised protein [Vibrio cholerae]|nr:Uncharacterised protein [Vibrio cholerae]
MPLILAGYQKWYHISWNRRVVQSLVKCHCYLRSVLP